MRWQARLLDIDLVSCSSTQAIVWGNASAMSSGSDDEWLHTLCRAPHRPLVTTPNPPDSDDEWALTLCRAPRPPCETGPHRSGGSVLVAAATSSSGSRLRRPPVATTRTRPPPRRAVSRSPHRGAVLVTSTLPSVVFRSFDQLLRTFPDAGGLTLPRQDQCIRASLSSAPPTATAIADIRALLLERLAGWARLLGSAIVFKVGIAADPDHRYFNSEFGYVNDRMWLCMDVVWKVAAKHRTLGPGGPSRLTFVVIASPVQPTHPPLQSSSPSPVVFASLRRDRLSNAASWSGL